MRVDERGKRCSMVMAWRRLISAAGRRVHSLLAHCCQKNRASGVVVFRYDNAASGVMEEGPPVSSSKATMAEKPRRSRRVERSGYCRPSRAGRCNRYTKGSSQQTTLLQGQAPYVVWKSQGKNAG